MSNRGYDVVVDIDAEGDLGHTDLQEDGLEFHSSDFNAAPAHNKIPPDSSTGFIAPDARGASASGSGSGVSSKRFLWSIHFYAQFFDVDTNEVLKRCWAAIFPRANFLDVLEGNPDLYGPFWIATTVVIILFLTGTINQYLAKQGEDHFAYNFKLLSGAAGLIYGYTAFVPVGLWGALKWFGSESANLLECLSLYGYANLIWIPVALISWSKWSLLNFIFVGIGFGLSALFLFRNLYPILSATDMRTSKILLIVVIVLHAGLAIAIKVLFFTHGSPLNDKDKPVKQPAGDKGGTEEEEPARLLVRMITGF